MDLDFNVIIYAINCLRVVFNTSALVVHSESEFGIMTELSAAASSSSSISTLARCGTISEPSAAS